ncbi:hypothetical protein FC70_GL000874 [Paucilactobacillus oligofermentans DSM 15707 = LMG 22743]|uniref:DUF6287 domain-containing protein n=1 Tax=Paucilactobacillus oligofermentans DSM 15707 = LMG 22743 TaxID=1423778 RepID=A0A0R1RFZ4_9LACO|nr:DUF6287 domain-containing protein [Paucilactobacillus oligofermentans]KRL55278.1 hypothetical protein FC70_GL000874 [Paucilactobacillus oligofermentans DSM 15707 = LMG 22743]CUS25731.1 Uncharacterized protein LACOL_0423 [Paucilactobacillus oligofermentans DSM 15707 = LMG 22743]
MKKFKLIGLMMMLLLFISGCNNQQKESEKSNDNRNINIKMNVNEIANGDYKSLNGTWKNGNGETIKVNDYQMKFSDFDMSDSKAPGTITKLNMNVPSMSDSRYKQNLRVLSEDGKTIIRGAIISPYGPGSANYEVLFMPSGKNKDLNNGDSTKDRIIAEGTQNDLTDIEVNKIYYRVAE